MNVFSHTIHACRFCLEVGSGWLLITVPETANPATNLISTAPTELDRTIATLLITATAIALWTFPRPLLQKLPCSALLILFVLYSLFGWLLGVYNVVWLVWLAASVAAAAVAGVMSIELGMVGLRALLLAAIAAMMGLFLGDTWKRVVESLALALALAGVWFWAVGGTRFRLEALEFDRVQSYGAIVLMSWEGLGFGWLMDTFLIPRFGDWVIQLVIG